MPVRPILPRVPSRARRLLGALAVLAAVVLGAAGCGPSPLARAYGSYKAQVEPLLEQEGQRWKKIGTLLTERQDDYAAPAYYRYLEETAVPFYTSLRDQIVALQPENERVAAAHALLVRFAEARLEFVHVEVSGRELFRAAGEDEDLLGIMTGLQEAENLRYEYQAALGEEVPDGKLSKLYEIVDTFRRKYFVPLQQGAMDPVEAQKRLNAYVIPALEELERAKYFDDDASRLLKTCVSAWLRWHRKLERAVPQLQRVWDLKARSEAAAKESEANLTEFKDMLEAIRRER